MKFSIRDLMFVMLLVAICLLWWRDRTVLKLRADNTAQKVEQLTAEVASNQQIFSAVAAAEQRARQARRTRLAAIQNEMGDLYGAESDAEFGGEFGTQHLLHSDDPRFDLRQHLGQPPTGKLQQGGQP